MKFFKTFPDEKSQKLTPEIPAPQVPQVVEDPIIDILKDDFEFEDDFLVLFSASKCPGNCPDC